jgi:hypothetical protein
MNRAAGELELTIGEKKFTLRPEFEAFIEMEDLTGDGIAKLFGAACDGLLNRNAGTGLTLKQTTAILYSCIKRGGSNPAPSFQDVGSMLVKANYRKFAEHCYLILKQPFDSDQRVEKKTEEPSA